MGEHKEALAYKIITYIKGEILLSFRFLDFALAYLRIDNSNNYSIDFGTDGYSLHYSSAYVINRFYISSEHLIRDLLHTIIHAIFKHPFSDKVFSGEIWELSCDIFVEKIIDELNNSLTSVPGLNIRNREYDKLRKKMIASNRGEQLLADYLYPLIAEMSEVDRSNLKTIFHRDDHSLWRHTKEPLMDESDKLDTDTDLIKNWTSIMERLLLELETYSKNIGNLSPNLILALRINTRKKYNYKEFLNKYMSYREVIKESMDEFDQIYYSYGLTYYGNIPFIESMEYRDQLVLEEFVIAIDTSGSVFENEAIKFLQTMFSIIRQNISYRKVNFHIIQADVTITRHDIIQTEKEFNYFIENFRMIGGGGTNFVPVFRVIDQLKQTGVFRNLKGMLYFTDGFGIYPSYTPSYDCVFVFFSEFLNDYNVPYWAKKLVLTKDDFI